MRERLIFILALLVWITGSAPVFAQESLSVTVTPPLFQLTIGPGESWSSSVKVVNNNAYDVVYAPQVVDFEAQGETGQGKFVPLIESFANEPVHTGSLGSWIELSKEPFLVKAGASGDVLFTVRVPENADPGGHYAAIMIGPYQGENEQQGSRMVVNSFVTSLLFVRIKGEIIESGRIREFVTDRTLYQVPEADFSMRFENTGNAHLQPRGSIVLYNMWGKERGQVQINENSNFGNVLPRSIRKYDFSWKGEKSLLDIGRYSAIVTLAYGDEGKQSASATTYFWVIPVIPAAITLGMILIMVLLFTWLIRRYIRRALELERQYRGMTVHPDVPNRQSYEHVQPISTFRALVQPIKEGVVDLRNVRSSSAQPAVLETPTYVAPLTLSGFTRKYSLFFVFLIVVAGMIAGLWLYFGTVLMPHRNFVITELQQGAEATSTR